MVLHPMWRSFPRRYRWPLDSARGRVEVGLACLALGGCAQLLGYGDEVTLAKPVVDGGVRPDAPGDAGPGVPADAEELRPFCERFASPPEFCSSFDGPSYLAGWEVGPSENGALERETAQPLSAPASLRVVVPGTGVPNLGPAVAFPAVADQRIGISTEFAIRVDAAPGPGSVAVAALPYFTAVSGAPPSYLLQFTLEVQPGGGVAFGLTEVDTTTSATLVHPIPGAAAMGVWSRVKVDLQLASAAASASNTLRVSVNDQERVSGSLSLAPGSGVPNVGVGISYTNAPTAAWTLTYDDVAVDHR